MTGSPWGVAEVNCENFNSISGVSVAVRSVCTSLVLVRQQMQVDREGIPSFFLASSLFYSFRPLNRFIWAALNLLVSCWMLLV